MQQTAAMKLAAFRVTRFRNILDSEEVAVEPGVTCLVGKNESGKTATLQALVRLKPAYAATFDAQSHYPRWLLVRDRRAEAVDKATPIWARFVLDAEDQAALDAFSGAGVVTGGNFDYSIHYDDTRTANLAVDEAVAVLNVLKSLDLHAVTVSELTGPKKLSELSDAVAARRSHLQSYTDDEAVNQAATFLSDLDKVDQEVARLIEGGGSLWQNLVKILKSRMPTFFYFGQYQLIPGRTDIRDLATDPGEKPGESGLQTARALLRLAQTDPSALSEDQYEERKAELEAVSNELTREVFEYWTQNESLSVEIDVDKETVPGPRTPGGHNTTAVARFLDLRVKDQRHGFTSNIDERSSGFRWFFSFLAAFSEFETTPGGVVVLLDEPALTLHGRAQADYLRFIEERLAPAAQVIYTTHSPFMVDVAHLERVRVVEDKGPDIGAKVTSEILAVDPDTLFPLQAALGYDIAQSLFVGEDNLLVEGTSDFTYLSLISDHLRAAGREGLDPRWRLLPAGGASNIPSFVALIGPRLDVTVLVDSGTQGMQRLESLTAKGLLTKARLLTVGQVTGTSKADIEDVFDISDYLTLYNGAFGTKLKVKDLPDGARIIDRISRAQGTPFEEHGKPAEYLLRHRDDALPALKPQTLDRFEALARLVNATLA